MRLHLPPSLRSALLASLVSFSGIYSYSHAATSADFWQIPDFGGPDFTWTGDGEGDAVGTADNWEGDAAPSRVDNKGPHLIFNGVEVTVTGNPPNTSDGGGISVTGNGSVSARETVLSNGSSLTLGDGDHRFSGFESLVTGGENSSLTVYMKTDASSAGSVNLLEDSALQNLYVDGALRLRASAQSGTWMLGGASLHMMAGSTMVFNSDAGTSIGAGQTVIAEGSLNVEG